MGKRKKTYVSYDYEEAYKHQLENLSEEEAKRCLRSGRKTLYATKEIRAGEQLEVEIYPEFTRRELAEIPEAGRRKKSRDAQNNLNEKNSRKACERLINENFGDRDIWATFTYTDDTMPKDMKEAQKNMQNYIRRLNNMRKKQGLQNTRYVYVTECSEKGRWHHHIVMDGDVSMDTAEDMWKLGERNEVRRLSKDENGLTGMAKYITKEKKAKSQKKWASSKGLRKPEERKNHYKFRNKDVQEMAQDRNCIEDKLLKWYAKEGYAYTSAEVRYNDFNGRWYIYARLRKPIRKGEKRKCSRKRD